jgi:hypothetical protein
MSPCDSSYIFLVDESNGTIQEEGGECEVSCWDSYTYYSTGTECIGSNVFNFHNLLNSFFRK